MKEAKQAAGRLRNVLLIDKIKAPSGLEDVIKSDVYTALENYFVTIPESVDVRLCVDEDNFYDIRISVKAAAVRNTGIFMK
ncbi:MAG: hypothetical protein LBQ27_01780 [Clostridiales bacterium]|jgi:hypothetical protein|nr:hypothetical protein [Clostridiales bacterium]